jgi:SAM-dependent methyltransferase
MARKQQALKKAKKKQAAASAKRASPARFYRRIGAEGWRNSNYFTYSSSSPAFRRWLATELGGAPLRILSIGCGNGELESFLNAYGHHLVGIDLSHPMLKRAARAGVDHAVEADARFLPFAATSFDLVLFPESIGHVPLAEVFAEAKRVLKRLGLLIVTTYASPMGVHPHYCKYRFADLAPAAAEAGFTVEAQRFLAAKQNSVLDAPSDAKATLLYFKARLIPAKPTRR